MASHVNGFLSPYLRNIRFGAVRPFIQGHVLDYGCNTGSLSEHIDALSYTAVDVNEASLPTARRLYPEARFFPVDHDFGSQHFDTITLLAVIEYIPDRVALYQRLKRHLAPQGRLVITSPSPSAGWLRELGGRLSLLANDEKDDRLSLPTGDEIRHDLTEAGLIVAHSSSFMLGINQIFVAVQPDSSPRQESQP